MSKANQSIPTDQYFATLTDPDQLAGAMLVKITEWRTWCRSKGLTDLWMRKLSNYYGVSANGNTSQQITQGGSEGELSLIKVNDLHQLIQAQLVLVTSNRPAGMAKAVNSDTKSLKSARIGTALAEYYLTNVGLEAKFVQAVEAALLCDESYVEQFWDKDAGDPIMVDQETQTPEMSGEVSERIHLPWNAARDFGCPVDQSKWNIFTFPVNKWDYAAAFPKFKDAIIDSHNDGLPEMPMVKVPEGSDMVFAHLLIHDRTPAVPDGRYTLMVGEQVILDTALPYKDYPVDRIAPGDVIDGPIGYSSSNDILGLEQVTDALHAIITSNNITFGGQNLIIPKGSGLNTPDFGKGLRVFEVEPDMVDKVKSLQLTQSAPETFEYIEVLTRKKEQQTGNSSGVIAQQAVQGASGSAMALVQAQSIQYNSGIQRSYYRLLSSAMTKRIGIVRSYADTPRIARIVGKSNARGLKEFKYTGKDLDSVSTIVYEMVNPISQTQGGRLTMGQDLIKMGCKDPKQYYTLVTTGSLDSLIEDDVADAILIKEENEALVEGRQFQAVMTEMHPDHIKSHTSVLSSVEAKEDPELTPRVLAHIQDHIDVWTNASMNFPGLLASLNIPPIPMAQPMMPPGAGPGGPGPGAGPGMGPVVGGGEPPAETRADGVKQPNLPTDPYTGQEAVVPGANQVA